MTFALGAGYDSGDWLDNAASMESSGFGSEVIVQGGENTAPVVSDVPQSANQNPQFSWAGLHNILGSIGSAARDVGKTARDLGTSVGSVKKAVKDAEGQYSTAEHNAESGNKLGQWWQYSSTTDKIMIGIGIAGLYLVVKGHK